MAEGLFRKKSINRISSPEELDGYIRVSAPGVWLILGALIALLAGLCVWGVFGKLDTTVNVQAQAKGGEATAVLSSDESEQVQSGMEVYWDDKAVGTVENVSVNTDGSAVAAISADNLADGSYDLTILVESISPMYFILN